MVSSDNETPTAVKAEPVEPPKRVKKGKKRATATDTTPATPKTTKKRKVKAAKTRCVTSTNQEDYQEEHWYDADEGDDTWYDAEEHNNDEEWLQPNTNEWHNDGADDTYPWPMWTLIYDELQVQEDPNVIHDVCLRLQTQHILQPWQLKQAPKTVLEMLFPVATHSRHLIIALQAQDLLVQKSNSEQAANNTMAKAVHKLAREQEKSRRAEDHQETSSDEDSTPPKQYDHYQSMKEYNLEKVSQAHTIKCDRQEKCAKRASVGVKKRGPYLNPGSTTEFTPTWMKTPLPTKLEDLPSHAHWVAAYWSKALTQLATQGHTKSQTLGMEQLLSQFLNINRACIENTMKTGWYTENEMWLTAVEATRRKDADFDVAAHFKKITPEHLKEGKQAMETSYKANTPRTNGKGRGTTPAQPTPTDSQALSYYTSVPSKGKYKSWYKDSYATEYAKPPGKYNSKWGKSGYKSKSGKGSASSGKSGAKSKTKSKAPPAKQ